MNENENLIQKYINEKKKLNKLVLQIVDTSEIDDDAAYQSLQNHLDAHQYKENKSELEHFLHLILVISLNHRREPTFLEKIKKILTVTSNFYAPIFINEKLFDIFQESKPILLFLIQSKIITIDKLIFNRLLNYTEMIDTEGNYFYPELNQSIKSGTIKPFDDQKYEFKLNENIENFELNRQKGENNSRICSIIREDLIDDFIIYVHKTSISLSSEIKRSTFETNPIFIEKDPTLIEYAAFFGSIQIVKYLEVNKVSLEPSIWLYAVHSDNAEIISFLEDKKIEMDDRTFSEAIKCHHNDVAHYIQDKYLANLNDEQVFSIYSSNNYEFFTDEIDGNQIFFNLCSANYTELVNLYLSSKKEEIDDYINQNKFNDINNKIIEALGENKLDVAYYLMLQLDHFPERLFQERTGITKIAFPPTFKSIGRGLFCKCSSLDYVSIPDSVHSIEYYGFACSSLKKITIPSSVVDLGICIFRECSSLRQVTLSSSLTVIGMETFYYCSSLTHVKIPLSVANLERNAFKGCSSLTHITIPSSVYYIGRSCFNKCTSLKYVTFVTPSCACDIGKGAFCDCSSLKQITIPSSVTSIGDSAFEGCSSLSKITIPSSVTSIGDSTFYRCSSLTQITIPSSVTSIGNYAFSGCSSLKQITIPSYVTFIGDYAFFRCQSLENVEIQSEKITIGGDIFDECTSLKQISIPPCLSDSLFYVSHNVNIIILQ